MASDSMRHQKKAPLIKLVGINARYTHSCLALFYLRHAFNGNFPEAQTAIHQYTINDPLYETVLDIADGAPFAVCISAAIWNSERVAQIVSDLHACLPECQIVLGGPQAKTLFAELESGLCSLVLGPIEGVTPQFYMDMRENRLHGNYGQISSGRTSEIFPFPYVSEDFFSHLKNRLVYYESSRGCPYSCTYCLSANDRRVIHKEFDTVRLELAEILRHNPKELRFVDRTFNDNPGRALAIWQMLLDYDCPTRFHFEIAPERFSEEMFAVLAKAPVGKFQFEIGVQSLHEETLHAIERRVKTTEIAGIVKRLAGLLNIYLHVDLILGLPYDTPDTFLSSFAEIFAMEAHYIQMGLLKILPDTPISKQVEPFGYLYQRKPPYSVFASRWMRQAEFCQMYWLCECVERMYNNRYFVSVWHYLREEGEDVARFFMALTERFLIQKLFERAPTQELLCSVLVEMFEQRQDRELVLDLLRFDWLHTGNRMLPDCLTLAAEREQLHQTKDLLYQHMPDRLDRHYQPGERNRFFKRIWCIRLSYEALRRLGFLTGKDGRLWFLPELESSLHRFQQVLVPYPFWAEETSRDDE